MAADGGKIDAEDMSMCVFPAIKWQKTIFLY
jgi:hypothetical protein